MERTHFGIVLMSALGDVALGLPVATAIRHAHPEARISWVAQAGPDQLVRHCPSVNEIVLFDRHAGWRGYRDVQRALSSRPFDVLLDLQVAIKAGVVTWLARSPEKWGVDRGRSRDGNWLFTNRKIGAAPRAHMADQFREFLTPIGIASEPFTADLQTSTEGRRRADEIFGQTDGRPLAALVLATSSPDKNWAAERYAELAIVLARDFGVRSVLCGGGSTVERMAADVVYSTTQQALPRTDQPINALNSGIPALLALLEQSALVISPDTGPLHIAIALGRPVIGLYGSTNPRWVGPYRRCHDLLVDRYGEPGERYASSSQKRPGRMARITVDDVRERIERWRAHYAPAPERAHDSLRAAPANHTSPLEQRGERVAHPQGR